MRPLLLVVLACVVAGCGSKSSSSASSASVVAVKAAFRHHGVPLQGPSTVKVAGLRVSLLKYDAGKLIKGRVQVGQWLAVLVFHSRSDADTMLSNPTEQQVIKQANLTVIAHENVVVTILHAAATPDHLVRVRAAVAQATGG